MERSECHRFATRHRSRNPARSLPNRHFRTPRHSAGDDAGLFYGLQTLPPTGRRTATFPCVSIEDHPRCRYRGPASRRLPPLLSGRFIKHYLDWMASCKLNTFHWHLTDDQGWRIEIKRYPRLTEIGGYRTRTQIGGFHEDPITYEQGRYGGYTRRTRSRGGSLCRRTAISLSFPRSKCPVTRRPPWPPIPNWRGHGPQSFETSGRWGVLDDVFLPGQRADLRISRRRAGRSAGTLPVEAHPHRRRRVSPRTLEASAPTAGPAWRTKGSRTKPDCKPT